MNTLFIEEFSLSQLDELVAAHVMVSPIDVRTFSSEIALSMLVVGKITAAGYYVHLSHSDETGEWEWEARIEEKRRRPFRRHDARQIWTAFDVSLERAICEAALRWSGKVEQPA